MKFALFPSMAQGLVLSIVLSFIIFSLLIQFPKDLLTKQVYDLEFYEDTIEQITGQPSNVTSVENKLWWRGGVSYIDIRFIGGDMAISADIIKELDASLTIPFKLYCQNLGEYYSVDTYLEKYFFFSAKENILRFIFPGVVLFPLFICFMWCSGFLNSFLVKSLIIFWVIWVLLFSSLFVQSFKDLIITCFSVSICSFFVLYVAERPKMKPLFTKSVFAMLLLFVVLEMSIFHVSSFFPEGYVFLGMSFSSGLSYIFDVYVASLYLLILFTPLYFLRRDSLYIRICFSLFLVLLCAIQYIWKFVLLPV